MMKYVLSLPPLGKDLHTGSGRVGARRRIPTPQRNPVHGSSREDYYKLMFEWMCDFSSEATSRRSTRLTITVSKN